MVSLQRGFKSHSSQESLGLLPDLGNEEQYIHTCQSWTSRLYKTFPLFLTQADYEGGGTDFASQSMPPPKEKLVARS